MWRYLVAVAFGVSAGWLISLARHNKPSPPPKPVAVVRPPDAPKKKKTVDDRPWEYQEADALQRDQESLEPDAPEGATAQCGDLTYSFEKKKDEACREHRGVVKWLGDTPPRYK